ncbi:thioesterase domain-containing protein [Nocardia sp. NPDC059177]|uniref:thioesterase domain-containing protein n=1 Tax=Nocardia sp. NPDC059177 TaxID=3346759 RepID=UPI0036B050FC
MGFHDDPNGTARAPACAWSPARPDACLPGTGFDEPRATSAALAPVLPIRPRGREVDGAPLFCLAGEAGLAWHYADLVTALDPRTPIYGLQALTGATAPRTVREAAARYVAEIRRIAPHGPYQLLGWSAGGFVAHEIAVTLRAAGEPVRVVLLDTDPAARTAGLPAAWSAGEYVHQVADLLGVGTDTRALSADAAAADVVAALAGTVELDGTDLDRLAAASHGALRMVAGHRPSVLPGELTVCVAGRDRDGTDRPDPAAAVRHWRPYVTGPVTGLVFDVEPGELTAPEIVAEIVGALDTATITASTSR